MANLLRIGGRLLQPLFEVSTARGGLAARACVAQSPRVRSFTQTTCVWSASASDLDRAKERLSSLKEDPGNDVKLKLYGLFKQATIGPCNTSKPGAFDFVGRAKWQAWSSRGDLSKSSAIEEYCGVVEELVGPQEQQQGESASSQQEATGYNTIIVSNEGGARTIMLNRPTKLNALSYEMYREVQQALREAAEDKSVVLVVITGAGEYYCSGNDLSNFATIPPEGPQYLAAQARSILLEFVGTFIDFPKPLIAAVNGPAVGVSVTVLGLCDLVYAADHATFHTPFMELGQSPEGCSSLLFPRMMGAARANEVLLGGRKLTAAEAYERGLLTRVIPAEQFQKTVDEIVSRMAALPPKSLQKSKELIRGVHKAQLHEANAAECELLEERWLSEECMEAIMAFMQRKKK